MNEIIPVKLTKKSLNDFIGWTTSRYNNYLGYGTKKDAVCLAFNSILFGFQADVWKKKDGTMVYSFDTELKEFEIKCAGPVGESLRSNNRNWKTKQSGDDYTVNCIEKTIIAKYSKRIIKFL